MTHKLLLSFDAIFESSNDQLLKPDEIPRGEMVEFRFKITNLGDLPFDGKIDKIGVKIIGGVNSYKILNSPISNLRRLDTKEISEVYFPMKFEGIIWVYCVIKSSDDSSVEYFQSSDEPLVGTDEWQLPLVIINREQLEILRLLKKINEKIK